LQVAPLASRALVDVADAQAALASATRRGDVLGREREREARAAGSAAARLHALARDVGGAAADACDADLGAAEADLALATQLWAPYGSAAGALAAETRRVRASCAALRDACDAALAAAAEGERALGALALRRATVQSLLDSAQDRAILAYAATDAALEQRRGVPRASGVGDRDDDPDDASALVSERDTRAAVSAAGDAGPLSCVTSGGAGEQGAASPRTPRGTPQARQPTAL
jgi:hypothetical protein